MWKTQLFIYTVLLFPLSFLINIDKYVYVVYTIIYIINYNIQHIYVHIYTYTHIYTHSMKKGENSGKEKTVLGRRLQNLRRGIWINVQMKDDPIILYQ